MPPIRLWKPTLAAGLLMAGADGAASGQPPLLYSHAAEHFAPVATPAPCPPAAVAPQPGWTKLKAPARGSLLHPRHWPEPPLGASVALHYQTHVANAAATRMALHDYDFVRGTDRLNLRGMDRVRLIAGLAPFNTFPVTVERLPTTPDLAERRRLAVLAELIALGAHLPSERVVVGPSPTAPLAGMEAERIYQNLLLLTESYGSVPPTTGAQGGTIGAAAAASGTGGVGAPTGR